MWASQLQLHWGRDTAINSSMAAVHDVVLPAVYIRIRSRADMTSNNAGALSTAQPAGAIAQNASNPAYSRCSHGHAAGVGLPAACRMVGTDCFSATDEATRPDREDAEVNTAVAVMVAYPKRQGIRWCWRCYPSAWRTRCCCV
jgi:hypothetical protein